MNRLRRSIHKFGSLGYCLAGLVLFGPNHCILAAAPEIVVPGSEWQKISLERAGLDSTKLDEMAKYLGGRGFVTRFGHQVYSWGEFSKPGDVASAVKPVFTHFLLTAVQTGKLNDVDTPLAEFELRLKSLNEPLGFKDRGITFRHCANQMSCYGVDEKPGSAFDYNDFQMALFIDTLFLRVFDTSHAALDRELLHPLLTEVLNCQDHPSFLSFGGGSRPGRLSISPRDFCRFGLLYAQGGRWGGRQLLNSNFVQLAVSTPLPLSLPRTRAERAEMIPGQRSLGSNRIPDDQTDHLGCYSWLWWVNGVRSSGLRLWPDAPSRTFAALGHEHGKRGMAVVPEWDLVFSWNDSTLDSRPWKDMNSDPHPLNRVFKLLAESQRPPGAKKDP